MKRECKSNFRCYHGPTSEHLMVIRTVTTAAEKNATMQAGLIMLSTDKLMGPKPRSGIKALVVGATANMTGTDELPSFQKPLSAKISILRYFNPVGALPAHLRGEFLRSAWGFQASWNDYLSWCHLLCLLWEPDV